MSGLEENILLGFPFSVAKWQEKTQWSQFQKRKSRSVESLQHNIAKQQEREKNTVLNLVLSQKTKGGHIHLNPAAIWLPTTVNFDRQNASPLLRPTIMLSSSTCFFHVS